MAPSTKRNPTAGGDSSSRRKSSSSRPPLSSSEVIVPPPGIAYRTNKHTGKKYSVPVDATKSIDIPEEVKNKDRRRHLLGQAYHERKQEKNRVRREKKELELRGERVKGIPRTVERLRKTDETKDCAKDEEVLEEDACDEFSDYFAGKTTPKLMVTTSMKPSTVMEAFLKELLIILPNCFYYKRMGFSIKAITKFATAHEFTDLIVFSEKNKIVTGMFVCHLPGGPTSFFRLTSLKLAQDMKGGAHTSDHMPEIMLKNFDTRLGHRLGRQFAALFPSNPQYRGRHVICLHNQRDFIFFRHHRYVFDNNGERCRLAEIGPRFTLKLYWMQEGTFNTKNGQFEFVWRPDLQVNKKVMFI
eukprot:GHVS01021612.1.p1 GENE.GHVS01021612.1~~GHVS01021612.1.p1  ORF type:complete len:375 (-),score=55.66 GHVS01021612.1:269-1339(-)